MQNLAPKVHWAERKQDISYKGVSLQYWRMWVRHAVASTMHAQNRPPTQTCADPAFKARRINPLCNGTLKTKCLLGDHSAG